LVSLKIAVVGSGISGLSAAWLLSQRHDVTLIEADDRIGGHSNTFMCPTPEGVIPIDTGFIVYNNQTYPNLSSLFEYLSVPTAESKMGFAVSLGNGTYEYSGAGLTSLIGHTSNLLNPSHLRMIRDLVRFFRNASAKIQGLADDVSLSEFMRTQNYSQEFIDLHLLPMAAAIWSCTPDQMLDYPAKCFLRFCNNHGLLNFYDRPPWRTVEGGSIEYVRRLIADSRMQIITACPIQKITRNGFNVLVEGTKGYRETFDQIVIATHADQALKMLTAPTAEETNILSPFQYSKNTAILHHDESFMPRRKRLWSSWNYVGENQKTNSASVTYWMNELQPLKTKKNIFVTLNAKHKPHSILKEFEYTHPVFNEQTSKMQKQLWSLQGTHRTWFCGAHFGSGFHEDGLQSGLAVAEQLGGMLRPWNLAKPDDRVHVTSAIPRERPNFLEAAE
jgi:uncharacterized protein